MHFPRAKSGRGRLGKIDKDNSRVNLSPALAEVSEFGAVIRGCSTHTAFPSAHQTDARDETALRSDETALHSDETNTAVVVAPVHSGDTNRGLAATHAHSVESSAATAALTLRPGGSNERRDAATTNRPASIWQRTTPDFARDAPVLSRATPGKPPPAAVTDCRTPPGFCGRCARPSVVHHRAGAQAPARGAHQLRARQQRGSGSRHQDRTGAPLLPLGRYLQAPRENKIKSYDTTNRLSWLTRTNCGLLIRFGHSDKQPDDRTIQRAITLAGIRQRPPLVTSQRPLGPPQRPLGPPQRTLEVVHRPGGRLA